MKTYHVYPLGFALENLGSWLIIALEGACPFANWFAGLDARAAAKVRTAIVRIETGNFGDVKPIGEGVSERRINFGPGYRMYFGQEGQRLVILLVEGMKKRQQRDIDQAKAYWQDYKQRK